MKTLGVIPARYASRRFPGKALAEIESKPLIQWVYEGATQASLLDELLVATDDSRIQDAVLGFGGRAVMTSNHHPSGSDRVAEVARTRDADIVVNIQGDEPLIQGAVIDQGVRLLLEEPEARVGTLVAPLTRVDDLTNPGIVKVVVGEDDTALYFSRAPIPHLRDIPPADWLRHHRYWKHIGLYVFRRDLLLEFVSWSMTPLERAEGLEQLRLLEHGQRIKVGFTDFESRPVDTPEDLEQVRTSYAEVRFGG